MKLLIVDDQRSVHLYIQEVIDLPSLKVSKVQHAESSGMQALELLRRCHLDIMILDIPKPLCLPFIMNFCMPSDIFFGVRRYVFKPIGTVALTLILCETYQVVYQHRLESYRRAFLLLCSHLKDMCTLQVRHIDCLLVCTFGSLLGLSTIAHATFKIHILYCFPQFIHFFEL